MSYHDTEWDAHFQKMDQEMEMISRGDPQRMIARRIPKPHVQKMIRALRNANLIVNKTTMGYVCKQGGDLLFRAMRGRHDYLVRMKDDLFAAQEMPR